MRAPEGIRPQLDRRLDYTSQARVIDVPTQGIGQRRRPRCQAGLLLAPRTSRALQDEKAMILHPEIIADARKAAVRRFEKALIDNDRKTLYRVCLPELDRWFCWKEAMRRVIHVEGDLRYDLRLSFYTTWTYHGDHIRQAIDDDLLLIEALRKLLPPYGGSDKTLYRGESMPNRKRRTYGPSWTPLQYVARSFAEVFHCYADGGAVLLKARVPKANIIAKLNKGYDPLQEREYLVDRRDLKDVYVLKAFPQVDPRIRLK